MIVFVEWGKKPLRAICKCGNKFSQYNFWKSGTNKSVKEIKDLESRFKAKLEDENKVLICNYKKFIDYFGILSRPIVYDYPLDDLGTYNIFNSDDLFKAWQLLRAQAAEVFYKLEKRGVYLEYKKVYPKYSMDVFSGRSKTTGFNIQGTNSEWNLRHINPDNDVFVNIDWIAADSRIASVLSNDDVLMSSFSDGDPYTFIEKYFDSKVDRNVCKLEFNKAVNSLNDSIGILDIFPNLKKWIRDKKDQLHNQGYVESLLGRKFYTDHSVKGDRRAFNGILQGSVAHAMNSILYRIDKEFGDIIFTEQHDSITLCVNNRIVNSVIDSISNMMIYPFNDLINRDFYMPVRINVGKSWGNYKFLKDCRNAK